MDGKLRTRKQWVASAALALGVGLGPACGSGLVPGSEADESAGGDAGAGAGASTGAAGAGGSGFVAEPGPTDELFNPDRLLRVEIEMAPGDWDELRMQTRSIFDLIGSSCLEEPPPRPFTYFPATVTVDGETVQQVGVRKKGFYGSLSEVKPSLKVKFSEYVEQEYQGEERLTLNNSISDASYVKQCIGYDVFRQAGVPAPRCNFATVTVNGESLGLFVNVESIKKRFLAQHFADNDGDLWEGALSDFRPGWVDTFQKKTNDSILDRSALQAVVDAVAVQDAGLVDRLAPLIDIEAFINLWASEFLLMHADGYARNTNNFYLYDDPTSGKLHFIPWGIDSILFEDTALEWEEAPPEGAVWAEGILAQRLYNALDTQVAYFAALERLLDEVWVESALQAEIDRMVALISDHVTADERAAFDGAVQDVRDFVDGRRAYVEGALDLRPDWSGPLRDPWCSDPIGTVSGTFDTTWGAMDGDDVLTRGTGTIDLQLPNAPPSYVTIASASGPDEDTAEPAVRLIAVASDTEIWVVQVSLTSGLDFVPGATIPVDWISATGLAVKLDLTPALTGGEPLLEVGGMLGDCSLTLTQAAATTGAPVTGSLDTCTVYEAIF